MGIAAVLVLGAAVPCAAFLTAPARLPALRSSGLALAPGAMCRGRRPGARAPSTRVRMSVSPADVGEKELKEKIARFYDQSSPLWEDIWGEHMHMGHYGEKGDEDKTDKQAQIDMVDRLLDWGGVTVCCVCACV